MEGAVTARPANAWNQLGEVFMFKMLRVASLATFAAVAVAATPAAAAPVAATPQAVAKARILRPLTLTRVSDLDFGTIVLGTGTWSGSVVSITNAGVASCGANLTCTAPAGGYKAAEYNVTGTNNATVTISIPASVTMTNATSDNLSVSLNNAQTSLVLTNSGAPGNNFAFGGSITLASNTPDGSYSGNINVTVDY